MAIKLALVAPFVAVACLTGANAFAQSCSCTGNQQVTNASGQGAQNLTTALNGNTVCVASGSGWESQEQHMTGGDLYDYKRGPSHPIDPRTRLGTWAVVGTGTNTVVTYTYTGGSAYSFKVCSAVGNGKPTPGSSIGFCPVGAGAGVTATLKAGTAGGCP